MKNRAVIYSFFTSMLVIVLLLIGVSYSYLRKSATQTGTNQINTLNCLNLSIANTYDDGSGNATQNGAITLNNTFPISDEQGLKGTPYSFTITNTCPTPIRVEINLESLSVQNQLSKNYIKYNIDAGVDKITSLLSSAGTRQATITNATSNNIYITYLDGNNTDNASQSFNLRLWVDEATTLSQGGGKAYQGKIVAIAAPKKTADRLPNLYNDAESGTLLNAIRVSNSAVDSATTKTIPGQQVATANEGLRSAADDYGTSYYYRGAVENNYVVFAKMCWRIVRIDGQGNIKLVLYNYNSDKENVDNSCNVTGGNLAFARVSEDAYYGAFNTTSNKNTYIGYMYSTTPDSNNYLEAHANDKDSTILTRLKTWYDNNFNDVQKNLLADTIWCNDKRLANSYNPDNWTDATINTGVGSIKTNYAARERLNNSSTAAPTLKCGEDKEDNKISKFTAQDTTYGNAKLYTTKDGTTKYYKIGLLTADEITYAGGLFHRTNSSYYLNKNASSNYWWTLSPFRFNGSQSYVLDVGDSGDLYSYVVDIYGSGYAVRPAVSLTSTARVASGGNGTATKPFVVVES